MDLASRGKSFDFLKYLSYSLFLLNILLIIYLVKTIFATHSIDLAVIEYGKYSNLLFKGYSGLGVILGIIILFRKSTPIDIEKMMKVAIINIFLTALSYPLATWIVVLINNLVK